MVNPQIVDELRELFRAGATPSQLIRHIQSRHLSGAGERLYTLVQHYFREAFNTPVLRLTPEMMFDRSPELRLAFLNAQLVPHMVMTRAEWDSKISSDTAPASWLDNLTVEHEADLNSEVVPEQVPELAQCWAKLDDGAKEYIRTAIGSARVLYQRVEILARLAEQLQLQVDALQAAERSKTTASRAIA